MISVFIVLTAGGLLVLALAESAFSLLMRLPERLEAERESESEALKSYLADPVRFFLPARVLHGLLLVLLVVLLSHVLGPGFTRGVIAFAIGIGLSIALGQVLPALIVRRSPERYLELLLPGFTAVAAIFGPLIALVANWTRRVERRHNGDTARLAMEGTGNGAPAGDEPEPGGDENRLLRAVVRFGETLVREVMTPRPDIVAIQADATIDDLRQLVREQEYSRLPVYGDDHGLVVLASSARARQ